MLVCERLESDGISPNGYAQLGRCGDAICREPSPHSERGCTAERLNSHAGGPPSPYRFDLDHGPHNAGCIDNPSTDAALGRLPDRPTQGKVEQQNPIEGSGRKARVYAAFGASS